MYNRGFLFLAAHHIMSTFREPDGEETEKEMVFEFKARPPVELYKYPSGIGKSPKHHNAKALPGNRKVKRVIARKSRKRNRHRRH